jgi:hypothetical protein
MQLTRFEAGKNALPGSYQDLVEQGCVVTFLVVDQHGNFSATTTDATNRENKIVTAALRLRSQTLKSAQKNGHSLISNRNTQSGDV